jgi:hypothetical protein
LDPSLGNISVDLTRRHKAAVTTVLALLIATLLLSVVAYVGKSYFRQQPSTPVDIDIGVRITILFLGLGAIVWRRTKFATMRLQDIGGLQGAEGLLSTLQKTTLQIAFLGAAIAAVGFIATLVTGNDLYTYWSAAISIVVLIYSYPKKSSWVRTVLRFADPRQDKAAE